MPTKLSVTADGSTDVSTETNTDNALSALTENGTEEVIEPVDFRSDNADLRYRYLQCNKDILDASAAGDASVETEARHRRSEIGQTFIELNKKLATFHAAPMLRGGDPGFREDHLAAAMLALWETFVGTDPDGVIVNEDGSLTPASGWDPKRGTFATLAALHVKGKTQRSASSLEPANSGISYNTWSSKPKVIAARRELAESLGRQPTYEEIAARATELIKRTPSSGERSSRITVATVRACLAGAPASLQALVSDDGTTTLGDMLADTSNDRDEDTSYLAADSIVTAAENMATLDLLALLLTRGVIGPDRTIVQAAWTLCEGRGSVSNAKTRALEALEPPLSVPADRTCATCGETYVYPRVKEPTPKFTQVRGEPRNVDNMRTLDLRQLRSRLYAEQAELDKKAHADHREALAAFRTRQRRTATIFDSKHRHAPAPVE